MTVYTLKANIDFPSSKSFRITTPYRQKTFNITSTQMYVDLQKLVELKPDAMNRIPPVDFYLAMVEHSGTSLALKYFYEARALISAGSRGEVASFYHNEETKIEVKISKP